MRRTRVTMLLENDLYPQDVRVRDEARALRDAGYLVHVIAPRGDGQPARETRDDVVVERFRAPRERGAGVADILLEYVVAHVQLFARAARALHAGADVLHLHNPPDTLFPAALLARAAGRRVVFDQHDLFPELFAEKFGHSPLVAFAGAAQWATARLADLALATNESQRAALLRCGVPSERAVIVRNAPPDGILQAPTSARTGRLDEPDLLYLGALEPQDGVRELPALLSRLDGARLAIVGWGSLLEPLRAEMDRRGLASRVRFTGRVSHDEALRLIAQADICLDVAPCTTLNHRTTMVKIAEYMALGKPVVTFALHETRATAGDAVAYVPCGDWSSYADCVIDLACDGERRLELGRAARRRSASLVWSHFAHALVEGYERFVLPPRVPTAPRDSKAPGTA